MGQVKSSEEMRALHGADYVESFEHHKIAQTKRIEGILKRIHFSKNDVVGDFACGNGILSLLISDQVNQCIGIDFSSEFIEAAKRNADENNLENVEFIEADIKAYCLEHPNTLDKAMTLDFSEHIYDDDFRSIYGAILGVLKPKGKLYLHTPNADFFVEILKDKGIMEQFPEHIAVRNAKAYISLLENLGFKNIEVSFIPHYNVLKHLHLFFKFPIPWKIF